MKYLICLLVVLTSVAHADDLAQFRKENEESIKKNWLVVVGLTWLKAGDNTIGSADDSHVRLPKSTPAQLGKIVRTDKKVEIEFTDVKNVKLDGKAVVAKKKYTLSPGGEKTKPNLVQIDKVEFFLIERPNGIGVRVKDQDSETLKNFKGLQWYEPKKEYAIEGKWKPTAGEKTLRIPDVLGNVRDEKINGSVVFKVNGKEYELFPTRSGDDLFFIFKDTTSGKATYGTGRFLSAKVEKDGKVMMDFNTAHNPPCAFIKYATCPIPPKENELKVAIEAGEKMPLDKH